MTKQNILLKGCRQHNLKNLTLSLPKFHITVITGVSGSGKSSLAFDTLYAEGQRRFLEYLSPQARQLLRQMAKPEVDAIEGLSPTLAVQQSRTALPSSSSVATHTDIYDFFCLLYARIGEQHSPVTGKKLSRYTRQEIIEKILQDNAEGTRLQLIAPVSFQREGLADTIQRLQRLGYLRLRINDIEFEAGDTPPATQEAKTLDVVVDRIIVKEGIRERLSSSVETTLDLSQGILKLLVGKEEQLQYLTEVFLCPESGLSFALLGPSDFNYYSPRGACPTCQGRGGGEIFNDQDFIFDEDVSVLDTVEGILDQLPAVKRRVYDKVWNAFCITNKLTDEVRPSDLSVGMGNAIILGTTQPLVISEELETEQVIQTHWKGLKTLIEEDLHQRKARSRYHEEEYVIWQRCPTCHGSRLKAEALACRIEGKNIAETCALTVDALLSELSTWLPPGTKKQIAGEILPEIINRLKFLQEVGLGYLELDRASKTLSEGESQRVLLASQIGARLSGIIYILDEPSRGLHRRDIAHLATVISQLKTLGNTVVLVEHDAALIAQADHIVEIGPGSGMHGGHITFEGVYGDLLASNSATGRWLSGHEKLLPPKRHRKSKDSLRIIHASLHNLRDLSIDIPLGILTGLCGVSGSGKSTLAIDIIGADVQRYLARGVLSDSIKNIEAIQRLQTVEQRPTGISYRSTPATYVGLMAPLRQLFAKTKLARARGYIPARFSTNKKGGRCEACEGLGVHRVDMEFMPELFLICEVCQGKRYNYETLQVLWEGLSIADVLHLPVEQALHLFKNIPDLAHTLTLMQELGLDYLTLGQNFTTLSGGEVQRLKLIAELARHSQLPTLYIMDEPCVGLHYSDVGKLSKILHRLVDNGHSVIVVEHNALLLKQCDWLIEMGPEGGPKGGEVIFAGTPEKLAKGSTPTAQVLS